MMIIITDPKNGAHQKWAGISGSHGCGCVDTTTITKNIDTKS
ncbi:hypothetical protein [Galbibacter mesophilus]|nr:hypothetical protein [Galbibacter mesophilus]